MLKDALHGEYVDSSVVLGESPLAQVHLIVRPKPGEMLDVDTADLEQKLAQVLRNWQGRPARSAGGPPRRDRRPAHRRPYRQGTAGRLHRRQQHRGCRQRCQPARCPDRPGRPAPEPAGRAARRRRWPAPEAVPPAGRHSAVGRAADDGEHGPARDRRAPVPPDGRQRPGVRAGLRGRVDRRRDRCRQRRRGFRRDLRPRLAWRRRERRFQPAGAGCRPALAPGRHAAWLLQVPAADRRAVLAGVRGRHLRALPAAGTPAGGTVRSPLRSGHRPREQG